MPVPDWLAKAPSIPPAVGCRRKSWIGSSVRRLSSFGVESGAGKVYLRVDPRAAILGFVGLTVCTTLLQTPIGLLLCLKISAVLAILTGARPKAIGAAWAAAGMLTAIMMLPALSTRVMPGPTYGSLGVSELGLRLLAVVVLRTLACLTLGIGLFSSNRAEDLFGALRWLRVPGIFITVLLLTYRYLQVMVRAALEAHLALRSRVADEMNLCGSRRWLGERVGSLFARSRDLGVEVSHAMVARGFDGEWLPKPACAFRGKDALWLGLCAASAGLLAFADRFTWF